MLLYQSNRFSVAPLETRTVSALWPQTETGTGRTRVWRCAQTGEYERLAPLGALWSSLRCPGLASTEAVVHDRAAEV